MAYKQVCVLPAYYRWLWATVIRDGWQSAYYGIRLHQRTACTCLPISL